MKVLHICSYYTGNKLYMNMVENLSYKNIEQDVYIPVRDEKLIGKNQLSKDINIKYYYNNVLRKKDRLLFFNKIKKQFIDIEKSVEIEFKLDFIHAHTLYSDGGTAYKLNQKFGIDYTVTVRNTDINIFFKYAIHLRPYIYKVLKSASSIVFISHAYRDNIISLLPKKVLEEVEEKFHVIPNGINDFWHENGIYKKEMRKTQDIKLLFIGLLNKNKNIEMIIRACYQLYEKGYKISLHIIGSGPLEHRLKVLTKRLRIENNIKFYGFINDKVRIARIMDECDVYVMPSHYETFGLVYIEAMTRGLPVVYSMGQGIDGFFEDGEVGYSIDPKDINMLCNVLLKIMENYEVISYNCISRAAEFKWDYITGEIKNLYRKDKEIEE
ncbi:glycosyltransferase family 4 protein [Virgibacillus necropolis]|uniref:Glycosyl transferase family 1 domain-containing protein n=1 Tax=Virgibacillus necropolis TaxID=163877 RepID=A0A221M996_9BACI|nr:glycosyltransferase family 4 protein [Virgibacillus necropolis]ASN04228.1 hypothetical protein CFK40_04000 [Virgibacillus necropolis]